MDWPPEDNKEKKDGDYSKERNFLINKIEESTPEEFTKLVKDFSQSEDKNNFLSNSIIKKVFSKYFSLFRSVKNYKGEEVFTEIPDDKNAGSARNYPEIDYLLKVFSNDGGSFEDGEDTLTERVYKIVMDLAHQYPDQVQSIWGLFWQTHGEQCRIGVLIDGLLGLVKDKKCSSFVSRVNYDMQYFYSFRDQKEIEEVITDKLDFDKEENFGSTFAMLELLKRSFSNLDGYAEDRGVSRLIIEIIKNSLNKQGSYLLRSKAEETLTLLENNKEEKYEIPFKISKNEFAFF